MTKPLALHLSTLCRDCRLGPIRRLKRATGLQARLWFAPFSATLPTAALGRESAPSWQRIGRKR